MTSFALFSLPFFYFFFFNDTATTEIYTLSLHDALPIFTVPGISGNISFNSSTVQNLQHASLRAAKDRKSTRLNSSHANISYAVFCLKKKKKKKQKTKKDKHGDIDVKYTTAWCKRNSIPA